MMADVVLHILLKDIQLTVKPVNSSATGRAFLKAVPSGCLSFPGDYEWLECIHPYSSPCKSTQHCLYSQPLHLLSKPPAISSS